jgi:hypothetical protein
MSQPEDTTDSDRIETAISWVKQHPELGIPPDITPHDCSIHTRSIHRQAMESTGPLTWTVTGWTVIIHGRWAVDLDASGIPKGPPRSL